MEPSNSNAQHGSSDHDTKRETQQRETVKRILDTQEDHYQEILGIPLTDQTPQPNEVTRAYRKMALLVHPDRCSDNNLKGNFTGAFKRLQNACMKMKGDIEDGAWFHPGAYEYVDDDDGPDPPRPQEENPPSPDDFHKKIYVEATPDVINLMKDPRDKKFKAKIGRHNDKIKKYNEDNNKPEEDLEDNVINLNTLLTHYERYADLLKEPSTQKSRIKLQELKETLEQINARFGYPSTWIPEDPPSSSEDTENPSQPGKGKGAADQAKGQGAAAASSDPDPNFKAPPESPQDTENPSQPGKGKGAAHQSKGQGAAAASSDPDPKFKAPPESPQDKESPSQPGKGKPASDQAKGQDAADQAKGQDAAAAPFDPDPNFKGIRTRDNEPILGYRIVGRYGRQYLVQTDGPKNPAYEFRSQAGDDGVGRRVGRAYEESTGAVLLGEVDKTLTKDHAHRYVGIKGVAYKPIQVQWDGSRERYPVTAAWAVFKDPPAEHWVYRTTVRRLAGKRDADLDIRDWSESQGLDPSERAPPRNYIRKNDAYDSNFPRRARTGIRADDGDREELRTRVANLENAFKTEQAVTAAKLDKMQAETNARFDELKALILGSKPSQG